MAINVTAKDMVIDIAIERVQGLISFLSKYREIGFSQGMEAATEVALEMDIDIVFRNKRKSKGNDNLMRPLMMNLLPHNLHKNHLDLLSSDKNSTINIEYALKNGEHSDIYGIELFVELKLIREFIKESMGPLGILKYLIAASSIQFCS
ncbi:hypothetical protein EJB05_45343, partial [Eragrostis curvula]